MINQSRASHIDGSLRYTSLSSLVIPLSDRGILKIDAPFPISGDSILQRLIHERDIYSSNSVQWNVSGITMELVVGTELRDLGLKADLEKRVEDRISYWIRELRAHHFLVKIDCWDDVRKSPRFQYLWDSREEFVSCRLSHSS